MECISHGKGLTKYMCQGFLLVRAICLSCGRPFVVNIDDPKWHGIAPQRCSHCRLKGEP